MKRTFIAIDIPPSQEIRNCQEEFAYKLANDKIKWVQEGKLHLTLKFLGNTEEQKLDTIKNQLKLLVKNISPFTITVKKAGVFKNIGDPRVIWLGLENTGELIRLKEEIENVINPIGFQEESREFRPHLTLGRVKFIKTKDRLAEMIDHYKNVEFLTFTVSELIYYESQLNKEGPVYSTLGRYKFGN